MYSILASLDEEFIHILKLEKMEIDFFLKFALLKKRDCEFQYFHIENKKNIRLNVGRDCFLLLNSICRQNHSCLNVFVGELIIEIFLDIISHEQR